MPGKAGAGTVICGIGNPDRRDDGAGPATAHALAGRFTVFSCESGPENQVDDICRLEPGAVIVIDSGDIDQPPGVWKRVTPEMIDSRALFSHRFPLSLFVHLLRECCPTVEIFVLQVKDIGPGRGLSPEVSRGVDSLCRHLIEKYGS